MLFLAVRSATWVVPAETARMNRPMHARIHGADCSAAFLGGPIRFGDARHHGQSRWSIHQCAALKAAAMLRRT
jgi:hypothetical protein